MRGCASATAVIPARRVFRWPYVVDVSGARWCCCRCGRAETASLAVFISRRRNSGRTRDEDRGCHSLASGPFPSLVYRGEYTSKTITTSHCQWTLDWTDLFKEHRGCKSRAKICVPDLPNTEAATSAWRCPRVLKPVEAGRCGKRNAVVLIATTPQVAD